MQRALLILNVILVPYTDWTTVSVMKGGTPTSSTKHTLGAADSCHDTVPAYAGRLAEAKQAVKHSPPQLRKGGHIGAPV
eukprot:1155303-Pelagomonas_calceolata.AAC.1